MLASQETGLVIVVALVVITLTALAGSHADRVSGTTVNNFLNSNTLIQVATDASFFAIMAIGATIVIISGGIDLSVGSIYALAGVSMALALRALGVGHGDEVITSSMSAAFSALAVMMFAYSAMKNIENFIALYSA